MTVAVGFWTHFTEQGYDGLLVLGLVAAGVYGAIVLGAALLAGGLRASRSFVWGAISVGIFVVALVFFDAAAFHDRPLPGAAADAYEQWEDAWLVGFVALYSAALALSVGVGHLLGGRTGVIRAAGTLGGFMLLTFGAVWYMGTCETGYIPSSRTHCV